jgi:hypothetical protein
LLELVVANRGNITESVEAARATVSLTRGGRRVAVITAGGRDVRPRTSGIVQFRYRGSQRGWVTAEVAISAEPGRSAVRRAYRIRL